MLYRWSIVLLCFVSLTACETPDDDSIAQAQACLDGASAPSSANVCLAKISGLNSPRANRVRCGIYFVQGGINNAKLVTAYQATKNAGSASETAEMMRNLVLSNTENANIKTDLKTACTNSGMAGLKRLGDLIYAATEIATLGGADTGCASNPATCNWSGNLGSFDPTSAAGQAVGQTIIDMANTTCNSSQVNPPGYCTQVNTAVQGGATPTQVATCLKIKLQNPNGSC